jgi:eukaryotic-like serine/threonine-protein kinase
VIPSTPAEREVLKRLPPRLARDPEARRQLNVEAAILSALAGRGAPRFVGQGEDAQGPWLRMAYVPSPTLYAHLNTRPVAGWLERAAAATFAALATVHEADEAGEALAIVHGDLSPANVAVDDAAREATILDFGLAVGRPWPRPPGGEFRGTVLYAAPEIARAEAFDARADLHALAASLLHVAAGVAPRTEGALAAAIAEAAERPLAPWAARAAAAAGLSARVTAVLTQCVAFEPRDRPGTAREAAAALDAG